MKGKKITSVNPMEGTMGFLSILASGGDNSAVRATAINTKLDGGITVDTCCASDTGVWETGIRRESIEGKWVIVSQYENAEEAQKGHAEWVKLLKEAPKAELKDINMWNL
jgi:hypothetical protein